MKKIMLSFATRVSFALILCSFFSAATFSRTSTPHPIVLRADEKNLMEIKLVQADEQKILLNVKLQNPEGSSFTLFITDESNNELFSKEYNAKNFAVFVTLQRSESVNSYKIGIRSANKQLQQNFSIVPTVKYVPEVIISKQ